MNPERTISIAFIKHIRAMMDKYIRPSERPCENVDDLGSEYDDNVRSFLASQLHLDQDEVPENVVKTMKEHAVKIDQIFTQKLSSHYDRLMTDAITETMNKIENYLVENYQSDELESIASAFEDENLQKLINDKNMFDLLLQPFLNVKEQLLHDTCDILKNDKDLLAEEYKYGNEHGDRPDSSGE